MYTASRSIDGPRLGQAAQKRILGASRFMALVVLACVQAAQKRRR